MRSPKKQTKPQRNTELQTLLDTRISSLDERASCLGTRANCIRHLHQISQRAENRERKYEVPTWRLLRVAKTLPRSLRIIPPQQAEHTDWKANHEDARHSIPEDLQIHSYGAFKCTKHIMITHNRSGAGCRTPPISLTLSTVADAERPAQQPTSSVTVVEALCSLKLARSAAQSIPTTRSSAVRVVENFKQSSPNMDLPPHLSRGERSIELAASKPLES